MSWREWSTEDWQTIAICAFLAGWMIVGWATGGSRLRSLNRDSTYRTTWQSTTRKHEPRSTHQLESRNA